MVRLYEYVDDAEKSGLFLRGRSKEGNTTFQVTPQGEQLLRSLDYTPGKGTHRQGPRIPEKLHWALYDIGWVYTNDGDISPASHSDGELQVEDADVEFTIEDAHQIESFLSNWDEDTGDVEQLAELLAVDTTQTPIWEIDTSDNGNAQYLCTAVETVLNRVNNGEWDVSVGYKIIEYDIADKLCVQFHIQDSTITSIQYSHDVFIGPEHGLQLIVTGTHEGLNWTNRKDIETQRQAIIESFICLADDYNYSLGEPTAHIQYYTEENPKALKRADKEAMATRKARS